MLVEVRDVSMSFSGGRLEVLRKANFTVRPGDIIPLLGANGAGKTTLLRIVCGLVQPGAGSVRVQGVDLRSRGAARKVSVGTSLYPERSFYFRLTCHQNLRYFAALHGIVGPQARQLVSQVLEKAGLESMANTAFMRLSLGQRKRLGLARSLLSSPRILVLDEPTANLDAASISVFYDTMRSHALGGGAVLFSTHQMEDLSVSAGGYFTIDAGAVEHVRPSGIGPLTRWVDVFPVDAEAADITDLETKYLVRRSTGRISVALPLSMSLPRLVAMLDERGVVIEKIDDHRR